MTKILKHTCVVVCLLLASCATNNSSIRLKVESESVELEKAKSIALAWLIKHKDSSVKSYKLFVVSREKNEIESCLASESEASFFKNLCSAQYAVFDTNEKYSYYVTYVLEKCGSEGCEYFVSKKLLTLEE